MVSNQTAYSKLEQRSVSKFLIAEKCKQCEIYRKINDVYGEACLSQNKILTNGLNAGLPLWACVEKTVHRMDTH